MWSYKNPVKILFGNDQIACLASIINGRKYALVTYPDGAFEDLTKSIIAQVGKPLITRKGYCPKP
jgi:alcohol dehydrogenase